MIFYVLITKICKIYFIWLLFEPKRGRKDCTWFLLTMPIICMLREPGHLENFYTIHLGLRKLTILAKNKTVVCTEELPPSHLLHLFLKKSTSCFFFSSKSNLMKYISHIFVIKNIDYNYSQNLVGISCGFNDCYKSGG